MKVLIVTNMYPTEKRPSWGAFVKTQVDSIRDMGVGVQLFIIDGYKSKLFYFWAIVRLFFHLCFNKYDLIHAHYGLCGIVARMQFFTPVLVSYCGDDLYGHVDKTGKTSSSGLFLVYVNKLFSKWVDGVIVKTEKMSKMLPIDNANVIPNGVNYELFRDMDKKEAREYLGLEQNTIYILFPYAKERVRKCYPLFEEAVNIFRSKVSKPVEVLNVRFRPIEEIPYYLNASDMLVMTSFWEGSPNIIKEAMAVNLRIVSVDVGDVMEVIGNTAGCEIVERDGKKIAESMLRVLNFPEKTTGRKDIEWLKIENIAERIIKLYSEIAKNKPA